MKAFKTLLAIVFCILSAIGCGSKSHNDNGNGPLVIRVPVADDSVADDSGTEISVIHVPDTPIYELKYEPVAINYTGSQAEKWMRDQGYTIRKDAEYYHIIRKDSNNDENYVINLPPVSVGAIVILPLYDKHSQSVGTLKIIDGVISVEITREGKLVRVLATE